MNNDNDLESAFESIQSATALQLTDDIDALAACRSPVRNLLNSGAGEIPFIVIPDGYKAADLEQFLPAPVRIREERSLLDAQSFIDYYMRFASDESVIFASHHEKSVIKAVIDYHGHSSAPDWGNHLAFYTCTRTKEWQEWRKINNSWMEQMDFAEFIEAQLADIREPTGAQMLEVATRMQATKKIHFTSGVALQSGDIDFEFREETEATANSPGNKGKITIPQEITLGLSVFEGSQPYEVKAKFRYRINDGQLRLKVVLHRPDLVIKDAFEQTLNHIQEQTNATVYRVA